MEETGQTVQETQKVQAEQTGENGKNVGMPAIGFAEKEDHSK